MLRRNSLMFCRCPTAGNVQQMLSRLPSTKPRMRYCVLGLVMHLLV